MGFINYRDIIDAFSVDFSPDNYSRKMVFRDCLSSAHKDWNEAKKNIQLYQAAIEHWKELISVGVFSGLTYYSDVKASLRLYGREIKRLKKELGELQRKCHIAKAYYKKACRTYMSYIELCKQ